MESTKSSYIIKVRKGGTKNFVVVEFLKSSTKD